MFDLPFQLPPNWEITSVGDLVKRGILEKPLDGNHGGTHPKSSDYVTTGIPFVMASDLDAGRVTFDTCKFISIEQAKSLRKGFSKEGDVLISHKATIGRTAIVQKNQFEFLMLTPQVTYYRVKDYSKLNNEYLKAYFDSSYFQTILNLWAGAGSTRAYLGITDQLKLPVIVPTLDAQLYIADISLKFNNKIHLNTQTNQTLESIAQAIFKSWFVDFEPVKAKMAVLAEGGTREQASLAAMGAISGKSEAELAQLQQQNPEHYQQLAETAALFPSAMVESELGEIPEGWEVFELNFLANLNEKSWTNKNAPAQISYVDLANTKWGVINSIESYEYNDAPSRARRILRKNDTIIGTVRPGNGSFSFIKTDNLTGSTGFAVLSPKQEVFSELNYIAATSPENIERLAHLADGGAYPAVRPEIVMETCVTLPALDEIRLKISSVFHTYIASFFDAINGNQVENAFLAELRDSLLPKLLSGELTTPLNKGN